MADRPGIMIYFDILPVLDELSNEQVGQLFKGALAYGEHGDEPNFGSQILRIVWATLKQSIDRDAEQYATVCAKNSYRIYCRWERDKGRDPLPYEEWYTSVYQRIPANTDEYQRIPDDTKNTNYNYNPTTTTTQLQPNYNPTTTQLLNQLQQEERKGVQGETQNTPILSILSDENGLESYRPPDEAEWLRLKAEQIAKLKGGGSA